ncbi:MAG: hypothetical protein AAGF32_09045 [Pseudomonadota bacterium]
MRLTFTAALLGAAAFAAPALAWTETQPATNDMAVWAYPAKANYCPAGLQPVMIGGVVCCGSPTHHGNPYAHPAPRRTHQASYVSYGKGSDSVVVYEKGQ